MQKTEDRRQKASLADSAGGIERLVLVCFFLSGLTGLIYEILWTRMIVKVIGCAPFAVSIILTVFMGGLGLGSYIAGRRIDHIKEPLKLVRIYGVLELAIGGYGLILPILLTGFRPMYGFFYNRLFGHFMAYSFLTFVGCSILLLIPVICMGATLPILCRFYVTKLSHLGSHAGRLYGLNTIGAAAGALLCGFWLINLLGVYGTLALAVVLNAIIGAVSIMASYRGHGAEDRGAKEKNIEYRTRNNECRSKKDRSQGTEDRRQKATAALLIFAVSGFCAMASEVIWAKLLGLIIGPTTYSFTIVLVTFITCLALGSILFGWLADRVKSPIRLLIYTQMAAGLFALLVSQVLGNSQFFFAKLIYHFQGNFGLLNILKAGFVFGFIFLPTICLGATFPLVGKIYTESISKVGRSIGFAYAINTIGCVLGSFCAGFVLIPLIGKENGLRVVISIQLTVALIIAVWLLLVNKQYRLGWVPAGVLAVLGLVLCSYYPSWNREALSFGRYHRLKGISDEIKRTGWLESLWRGSELLAKQNIGEVVYYGDGIAGFTTVLQTEDAFGNTDYSLVISGKPDASTHKDMPAQTLCAHFPMMFHPNPKRVMVLGHASGITAGEILCYPIEKLDILEISPEVVTASGFFKPWNNNVLSNPKAELIIQDGRAHLQLTDRRYDVIISEPSNPWMAGIAALFTCEFFALAKDKLDDEGIFCQWLHSYQMDWPTFAMICRSFAEVYPNNTLFQASAGDYFLLGFKGQEGLVLANAERNLRFAQKSKNVELPNAKVLYRMVKTEDLSSLAGEGPVNTDARPRLEFAAPKTMFIDDAAIVENVRTKGRLKRGTQRVVRQGLRDVDLQIDFAELFLSVKSPFADMVSLAVATPQQQERFFKVFEGYCANNKVDYSIIEDEQLKRRCRLIQINAIISKLDSLTNKALAYYTLGDLYREGGQLVKAQACYSEALQFKPDHAELYNDLGVVLHYQGKLDEAVGCYDEALRLKPDYPEARNNRGKALAQLRVRSAGGQ